jgi:hypothetical protein
VVALQENIGTFKRRRRRKKNNLEVGQAFLNM